MKNYKIDKLAIKKILRTHVSMYINSHYLSFVKKFGSSIDTTSDPTLDL